MSVAQNILDHVNAVDHRVMRRVNWWPAPRWCRLWMICATRGGDGWLWYAMGLIVLLFGGASRFVAVGAAVLATFTGIVMFLGLKRVAKRRRPCAIEPHCWASILPPDQFSFPSGHSITAFAIAVPVSLAYPALLIGMLFCATSIAISRILLGMHFLSDVVIGSLMGVILGFAAFAILS